MLAGAKYKRGDGQFIVGEISFLSDSDSSKVVAFKQLRVGNLVTTVGTKKGFFTSTFVTNNWG